MVISGLLWSKMVTVSCSVHKSFDLLELLKFFALIIGREKIYTQPAIAWLRETRTIKAKISLFGEVM
jgi:hypothetical protein